MALNSVFSWLIAKRIHQMELFQKYPEQVQEEMILRHIQHAGLTEFGIEHDFLSLKTISDYQKAVPVRNYDQFRPYIDKLREGEQQILWPSKLKWFAKSSGTTSDKSKYIPVSKEALEDCHYKGGKDMLGLYCHTHPDAKIYAGKNLVMGGSSKIAPYAKDCYTGDLSAIIIKNLPFWVELRRTPNRDIALLDNWEEKIELMVDATIDEDVRMITGVPSWTLVLIRRMLEKRGVSDLKVIWPNLELFIHGGVSFKPYQDQYDELISQPMNYLETYNASEGFFGIQDRPDADDMLLMLDYGIFYEFMPLEEVGKDFPKTLLLNEVELNTNYAIVISTNAGLWRYLVGDTIRFTSREPFRIQVTGRTKHFLNAFGEEVIVDNSDEAIHFAATETGAKLNDYTAAPIYMKSTEAGGHEWVVEFSKPPLDMNAFCSHLDTKLRSINSDYDAKRTGNLTMRAPVVHSVPNGTFYAWLKSRGKIGGQHKVPRLCNDRQYVEGVLNGVAVQH
ncbi:MAG: GH3 auxin-responsive promoter family protein [Flavobacteriales bacterium]|nr:GH3 auxin-responsive promoter family protein [Flavobacteriales bacterium]